MYCPLLSCNIISHVFFLLSGCLVWGVGAASHCHHDSVYGVIGLGGIQLCYGWSLSLWYSRYLYGNSWRDVDSEGDEPFFIYLFFLPFLSPHLLTSPCIPPRVFLSFLEECLHPGFPVEEEHEGHHTCTHAKEITQAVVKVETLLWDADKDTADDCHERSWEKGYPIVLLLQGEIDCHGT